MFNHIHNERKFNEKLIKSWINEPRDYLWASEIGKPHYDIYHKLIGTKPDNPITIEALGKIQAGEMFEEVYVNQLRNRGISVVTKIKCKLKTRKYLTITGEVDCQVRREITEIKSVNSNAFWHIQRKNSGDWFTGFYVPYYFQLITYLKAKRRKKGKLIFISRDDTTKAEITVYNKKDTEKDKLWHQWMKEMTQFYKGKKEPPKIPKFVKGKVYNRSTKEYDEVWELNKQLEYSNYRGRIVGMDWEDYLVEAKEELKKLNSVK